MLQGVAKKVFFFLFDLRPHAWLKANPEKIEVINNIREPESVRKVKSLLGMAQYILQHIPEYATPLRALTKKETPWQWSDEQQHAFDKLKDSLIKSHVILQYCSRDQSDSQCKPCQRVTSTGWQGYQLCKSSTQRHGKQIRKKPRGKC